LSNEARSIIMTRPPFLSLDGIDGTGKSTQARRLADWLRGRGWPVACCTDPGGTPVGDHLRALLLDHRHTIGPTTEALLFMASRAELVARVIEPALTRGMLVLSDRYLLATVAYQGYGAGLNVDDLWAAGLLAASHILPELTIVLDLPVEIAQARRGRSADRLESRAREFHERVRQGYLIEARRRPDSICVVDAAAGADAVHAAICKEVERVLAARPRP
jgi:dTMP kinase